MNKEAFLKSFKRHAPKYRWEFDSIGGIRAIDNGNYFCPITLLHYVRNGKHESLGDAGTVGEKDLGMSSTLCNEIMKPADDSYTSNPRLRARMLKIVGLS